MDRMKPAMLIANENEFQTVLRTVNRVFILFYAEWCGFSRRFLPVYEKWAERKTNCFFRIIVDDNLRLSDEYDIDVVPTVLFFENGVVSQRLDGTAGVGLSEQQLEAFVRACD
jgi:thioredoxin 1